MSDVMQIRIHQFRRMLPSHRAPEVPVCPGLPAAPTRKATFQIPRELSRRVATRRTENAERRSDAARRSDARCRGHERRRRRRGTLSPVKLRNIPREILQPARAGSSGTIPHLAQSGRATLRTTKIDDTDFGGRILFRVFLSGA